MMTNYSAIATSRLHYPKINITTIVVFGLPLFFWAAMLLAPSWSRYWVWLVASLQMCYFFVNPTTERAVWVLLSYLFSLGGGSLAGNPAIKSVPAWMAWLSYVVIPVACLQTWRKKPRSSFRYGKRVFLPLVALISVSLLSALIHRASIFDWLGWQLHFLRYPLFFLLLINSNIAPVTYRSWINTFIALAVLQIPTTIGQFLVFGFVGDAVVGTMFGGQTGLMGLVVAIAFCAKLGQAVASHQSLLRITYLFTMLIPLILGGAGFSLLVSILLFFYLYLRSLASYRMSFKSLLMLSMGFVLTTFLIFSLRTSTLYGMSELTSWMNSSHPTLTSIEAFTNPLFANSHSRQQFAATTITWFSQNPQDLFLGSLGPQIGLGHQRASIARLLGLDAVNLPMSKINVAVGLPRGWPQFITSLPRILLEVGLLGLLCFLWLFWAVRPIGSRASWVARYDVWFRGQMLGFNAIWLLYVILGTLYIDIWRHDQPSFAFWLWAAALYKGRLRMRIK